jgi:hypothetical protein
MGNTSQKLKSEWPELVGKTVFESLRIIKKDRPDLQYIEIIEYNSPRYEYVNENLDLSFFDVLVKCNNNIVIETPFVIQKDYGGPKDRLKIKLN